MASNARALVIIDLQNEFLSPTGRFPIQASSRTLLANLRSLLSPFREHGRVFWVRSEYDNDPSQLEELHSMIDVASLEPAELFLEGTHVGHRHCCEHATFGAEFDPEVVDMIKDGDVTIVKTCYSAFKKTSLLESLRREHIQEVFFCGLLTNTCVSATVTSALRIGLTASIVTDCLGWRNEATHTKALSALQTMGALLMQSSELAALSAIAPLTAMCNPIGQRDGPQDAVLQKPIVPKKPVKQPNLNAGEPMGAGDTSLVLDVLPDDLARMAFERVKEEVAWETMYHRGGEVPRRVAVEGRIEEDGSIPIYRHPADESPPLLPFSPTVSLIRRHVEEVLKHPVNHVLIQHYRNGEDYISEHSDKTVDVVCGSKIVNVSLGAQRVMFLRTKKAKSSESDESRTTQRIPLPHNSMFVLGLETNQKWLHGIRRDGRSVKTKTSLETAYSGERISLTFRNIGTFLTSDESHIYGQGATGKIKEDARPVINGDKDESEKLLIAFGEENHDSDFDWEKWYGSGSDVLHFKGAFEAPVEHPSGILPRLY